QDVPAEPGARRHPVHAAGSRPRESRHHRLRRRLGSLSIRFPSRLHMTATLPRYAWAVSAERFLNSCHNASTPPGPDVPAELAAFMLAVDPVLAQAAELARVAARGEPGVAGQTNGE